MADSRGTDQPQGPRRPAPLLTQVAAASAAEGQPGRRAEFAEELVDALLQVGRDDPAAALRSADELGLATLADNWSAAEPTSRPGLLWVLHLLRTWCYFQGQAAARYLRAGGRVAPVVEAIAGLPEAVDAQEVADVADRLLLAAYGGRFESAAEQGSALAELVSRGMAEQGEPADLVARTEALAKRLAAAARVARDSGLF